MNRKPPIFPIVIILLVITLVTYRYGEQWLRSWLLYLSSAQWARDLTTKVPLAHTVANRFVAGEDTQAAINTTRQLNQKGMLVTLDYLGESVTSAQEANIARDEILNLLDEIQAQNVQAGVSVKLSQIGLKVDQNLAQENIRMIVQRAQEHQNFVRIDMEESAVVDDTLDIYRHLRRRYALHNVGVVIQSYLYRSQADMQRLITEGASVRLCKGAYMEPPDVAFPVKADTDNNFIALAQLMLSSEAQQNEARLAVATHDSNMIQAIRDYTNTHQIPPTAFEFQMLYGIRRELQEQLVTDGYQVRIYVPYGTAWYPYFVRRLAERPANLWFFVSNFVRR